MRKKDINPSLTPYFFKKSSPKFYFTSFLPSLYFVLLAYQLLEMLLEGHRCFGILSISEKLSVSILIKVILSLFFLHSLHSLFSGAEPLAVVWELL